MIEEYLRARKLALKRLRRDTSQGRYPYPAALDDILKGRGCQGEVSVGRVEIDPLLIAGTRTRGRQNCFSSDFMPLLEGSSEFAAKWAALFESVAEEGIREPVLVYEYLQRFYVQEGNKRVSVARFLELPSIPAEVVRVVPMPSDEHDYRVYRAFIEFYRVCPLYGLIVSDERAYERLAALSGLGLDKPWPDEEVRALKAFLFKFQNAYRACGGESLDLEVGDALLVFVGAYGYREAVSLTQRRLMMLMVALWGEFKAACTEGSITYLESPSNNASSISGLAEIARAATVPGPTRVAFIYDEDAETSGWIALHEQGRLSLEERMGASVQTFAYPECASDAAFDAAMAEAVAAKADIVVTVQPTQMRASLRAAMEHPEISFFNCSVSLSHTAVRTFACRMYEAKFLLGLLAGALCDNHLVGYVAESPVFGTVAEINAFARGVAMADPAAKVVLEWVSKEGYDWRRDLLGVGARVISGRDNQDPKDPGRPWGLFRVAGDGRLERLAQPVWDWGRYYELIVRSVRGGTTRREARENKSRALNYWWGLSSGVLDVNVLEGVPSGSRELVNIVRQAVLTHRADPFAGKLVAQGGEQVQPEGAPRMAAEAIVRMSWLAENVVGALPGAHELVPAALEQARVVGLAGVADQAVSLAARGA